MKEMVSTKLAGGLGNYMFQIAAAYGYGLNHKKQPFFSTNDSVLVHKHVLRYKDNVLSKVNMIDEKNYIGFKIYNEKCFNYNEIPVQVGNVYLNGYFQSEKYFKDFEEDIRNLFTSYDINIYEKLKNILENKNTCSIHVRRGDFLKYPDNHPIQDMNYYMKAIKKMPKDSVFLIFSDDIKWCKENFPNNEEMFIFVEGNEDYEDLKLMSMCKNNIVCNSTFSWWGAWLNNNPNKIVVAPKKWFGPAYTDYDTSDLYCEDWILL